MRNGGMCYLLDNEMKAVACFKYRTFSDRKKGIDRWKREYAAAFQSCAIQISPDVVIEEIDDNGTNLKRKPYSIQNKAKAIGGGQQKDPTRHWVKGDFHKKHQYE